MTKILAFAGSTRRDSWNKRLLHHAGSSAKKAGAEVTFIDVADYTLPLYDGDLEAAEGVPKNALKLKTLFKTHDALLIAAPEYNSSVTPLLKNMLDWLVSSSTLVDKPVALITASLGGEYAHASLLLTLGALSANVIADATLLIQFIRSKMDSDRKVKDAGTVKDLQEVLIAFINGIGN